MSACSATGATRRCASREFELEGDEAILRKEGDRLVVEPVRKCGLVALLSTLESLEIPFADVDEDLPPPDDVPLWAWHSVTCSIPASSPT